MNSVAAAMIAVESAPTPDDLRPRRGVSVIMVVYMTGQALEESVACVLREPLVDEFILVDNGSTLPDAARLRTLADRDPRVVLVTGQGNVGFARGANLGAARAKGEVLVFLNPDAFLQADCIEELVGEIAGRASPCIVGGRVLNADRTEQRGARRGDITPMTALMSLSTLARRIPAWRRYEVHWESQATPDMALAVPTISGACFAARREDFKALGGFDEGYFLHVEDIDLCWRARRQGGAVLFQPNAKVVHLGHTSNSSPWRVELHKGRGLIRYFLKRAESVPSYALALALSPVIMFTALARPLLWSLRGRRG